MMDRSIKRIYLREDINLTEPKIDPYICFREHSSDMIVVITHSGWCLKYTISESK